jgi:hypothetical protein
MENSCAVSWCWLGYLPAEYARVAAVVMLATWQMINDSWDHAAGDVVPSHFVEVIRSRHGDMP